MNYRLIRNIRRTGRFGLAFPLLFLAAVAFFHFLYPVALGALAFRLAAPLWRAERFLGERATHLLSFFSSREALVRDVERLSLELQTARELLYDRELLREENKALREQFSRADAAGTRIVGFALALPPHTPYDTVLLDVGERDGVAEGDAALAGAAVLGTVTRAYPAVSVVTLFSSAERKTPVQIMHEGRSIPVEAVGKGGGAFAATLPKDIAVGVGDSIWLAEFGPLLFARVDSIEGSAADSFQTVRFKNPVSLQTLRVLEVRKTAAEDAPL